MKRFSWRHAALGRVRHFFWRRRPPEKSETKIAAAAGFVVTCGLPKLSQMGRNAKIIYG
jgi:hypothetical protein